MTKYINFAISLQYLKKEVSDEVDFLQTNKGDEDRDDGDGDCD